MGVGLLGFVLGGLPLGVVAEYQVALGHGENALLRGLSYVTGIAGTFVALRLLRKRHASRARAKRTG